MMVYKIPTSYIIACTIAFVAGCSTSSKPGSNPETEKSVDTTAFSSDKRHPSSEPRSENEVIFQLMLSEGRFNSSLQAKIDQVEEAFYRANFYQSEFDRMLNEATAKGQSDEYFQRQVISSGVYPRLVALQILSEEVRDLLVYIVKRMDEVARDTNGDAGARVTVSEGWRYLTEYLSYTPKSLRLAIHSWAEEMAAILPQHPGLVRPYRHLLVGKHDEILKLAADPQVAKHLAYLTSKMQSKPAFLGRRMDDLAASLKPDLEENAGLGRSPQSLSQSSSIFRTLANGQFVLTFEDAVNAKNAGLFASTLKGRSAVVFLTAEQLARSKAALQDKKFAQVNFENGTSRRKELTKFLDAELSNEISHTSNELAKLTQQPVRYLRLPYSAGSRSTRVNAEVQKTGLKVLTPTIESLAWHDLNPQTIAERVRKQMNLAKSGVIAMHRTNSWNLVALSQILSQSQSNIRFVSAEEVKK